MVSERADAAVIPVFQGETVVVAAAEAVEMAAAMVVGER